MSEPGTALRIETLRWRFDHVEMIDQRLLPQRFEYVACRSADAVAGAIRDMVIRGAPAIGCAAAYGVALAAQMSAARPGTSVPQHGARIARATETIGASRPTAVNLFWALARMHRVCASATSSPSNPEQIAHTLLGEAHAIVAEDIAINRR